MKNDLVLDISRVPFSRRGALIQVLYETQGQNVGAENGLYLSQCVEGSLMGGAQFYRNKDYLLVQPLCNGSPIDYEFSAACNGVVVKTSAGDIKMTFDRDNSLRIFSDGPGIRLTAKMGFGDTAMLCGSAVEAMIDGAQFFFIPMGGTASVDSHYNLLTYRYTDPVIEFVPTAGTMEVTVFSRSFKDETLPEIGGTYSELSQQMAEDFARFAEELVPVSDEDALYMYSLWTGEKPFKGLSGDCAYPSNVITTVLPKAEDQIIASLPFTDAAKAVELISRFEPFMTPSGLLPEQTTRGKRLYQTVATDVGYAVLALLKKAALGAGELQSLYHFVSKLDSWWTDNRSDDSGNGFFYAYRFESGYPESSMFYEGMPAYTPDLMTKLVLSAQALSDLARQQGEEGLALQWKEKAEARFEWLMSNLWNGKEFGCLVNGKWMKTESALSCYPLLLGAVLPRQVADKLADSLMKGECFVPNRGIRLEADSASADVVLSSLYAAGLVDCMCIAEAKQLLKAVRSAVCECGLAKAMPAEGKLDARNGSLYPAVESAVLLYAILRVQQGG